MSGTMQELEGGSSEADSVESCNECPRTYAYHSERIILYLCIHPVLFFLCIILAIKPISSGLLPIHLL